jgi:hypothetical protein
LLAKKKKSKNLQYQINNNTILQLNSIASLDLKERKKKKKGTSERNSGVWEESILKGCFFS